MGRMRSGFSKRRLALEATLAVGCGVVLGFILGALVESLLR